jgi:hypothetical protein
MDLHLKKRKMMPLITSFKELEKLWECKMGNLKKIK